MPQLALEGLRILDLTQVAVGPYATLLLGFMGAEVIKVESCARMDISRGAARPTPQGEGLYPGGEPGERPWNRTSIAYDHGAPRTTSPIGPSWS